MNDRLIFYTGLIVAGISVLILIVYFLIMKIRWTALKGQLDAEYGEIKDPVNNRKVKK